MARFNKKYLLALWAKYERPLSTASLIVGFTFDLIIAKRPDSLADNVLLLGYLLIAAFSIIILSRRTLRPKKVDGIEAPEPKPLLLLLVVQFCFGGLASNLLVLYGHSGTLSGTILFLGLLAAMLIGNEFLRDRYDELRFNLAVYYTLLLTYLTIAVPTFILHHVDILSFLLSGILSLAGMALFIVLLAHTARLFRGKAGHNRLVESSIIIGAIYLAFNGLYFMHLIPPVPLSVKAMGIYHSITHDADGYSAQLETPPWWQFWIATNDLYHVSLGQPAYCFSAIFAPSGVRTPIVHHWEWYDPQGKDWVNKGKVTFPIVGGRTGGYYGYSIMPLAATGAWRCNTETLSGALIGRSTFTVVPGMPELEVQKL